MKKFFMLLHTGERPDLYLNLSLFLEHIGIFVYDNREVVLDTHVKRDGIAAFVYLISDDQMKEKFKREAGGLRHARVILTRDMAWAEQELEECLSRVEGRVKLLCSDDWEKQAKFVLRYLAGSREEYDNLVFLYEIFSRHDLILAYYCSEYMILEEHEWGAILHNIINAVSEFNSLAKQMRFVNALYAEALAMKRVNDICQKISLKNQSSAERNWGRKIQYYQYTEIRKKLVNVCMADPELKMAFVFLADAEERAGGGRDDVEACFRYCSYEPMAYYVFYKKALFFQRNGGNPAVLFRRSTEMNPGCYRSWYKLGLLFEGEKQYEDAISCYKKILDILKGQTKRNNLHPIEYEYVVKSYFRIGYNFRETAKKEKEPREKLKKMLGAEAEFRNAYAKTQQLRYNKFLSEFFKEYVKDPEEAVQYKVSQNPLLAGIEQMKKIRSGEWV